MAQAAIESYKAAQASVAAFQAMEPKSSSYVTNQVAILLKYIVSASVTLQLGNAKLKVDTSTLSYDFAIHPYYPTLPLK